MQKFRLDLRFPAFGGGGAAAPPPPPAVPKTPLTPDTSKLARLQKRTGNARGIAGTIKAKTETTGASDDNNNGGIGGLMRALRALTGS